MLALKSKSSTVQETLRAGVLKLQQARIESASLDARLLLEHVLHKSREQLLMALEDPMPGVQEEEYFSLIEGRVGRKPVSQLIGKREFWGMEFKVTADTLDPRPDSETLIEAVLSHFPDRQKPLKILDLGTGTGCLCLSLLKEFPNATAIAVDKSEAAIAVAKENTICFGLQSRVAFYQSDWCEEVAGTFDLIVSNPPYIPSDAIELLAPEVARHEPRGALDGGADGLDCYRAIINSLPRVLEKDGVAAFEMGMGQQSALEVLAHENGLQVAGIRQDMSGIARCILLTTSKSEK